MRSRTLIWGAGLLTCLAAPATAGAATVDVVGSGVGSAADPGRWTPSSVRIQTGDTVRWSNREGYHNVVLDGTALNGDGGMPDDPDWTEAPVQRTFTATGSHRFVCSYHPGMEGTIQVGAAPEPQPGGGEPEPTTPAPGSADTDRTAPRLSGIRVRALRRGARVRFRLSEAATVSVVVRRRASGRVARRVRVQLRRGRRSLVVRGGKLRRGRYTLSLRARDAMGNRSSLKRRKLTINR